MFDLTTLTPSLLSALHKYSKKAPEVTLLDSLDLTLVLVKLKVQKQLNIRFNPSGLFCKPTLNIRFH